VDGAGFDELYPPTEIAGPVNVDNFQYSMARYMIEGDEREEAKLLLACRLEAHVEDEYNDFSHDQEDILHLWLYGPRKAYDALVGYHSPTHVVFRRAAEAVCPAGFDQITIRPFVAMSEARPADWRNELLAVLDGRDVDNQAIGFKATRTYEGLRFRSESEVRIAEALDRAGVMYVPNCRSRVGSKDRRRNIEADFLVMTDSNWGVLEVDGSQWHAGSAARDHNRDRPFHFHGAEIVQRFDAAECFETADAVVAKFLKLLRRQ
jgi:hypothetical protein